MSILLIISMVFILWSVNQKTQEKKPETQPITPEEKRSEVEERKVSGYHLVTYAQPANTNSFLQSLTVTASNEGKVRFVIGSLDENSIVQARRSFEIDCQKGKNTVELLSERHLIKQGEYLMMDIAGQDVLYTQAGTNVKSLVQNENVKFSGQMVMHESEFILPFEYALSAVQEYHALFIGNEITVPSSELELNAVSEEQHYYHHIKTKLETMFAIVKTNRIKATQWEETTHRKEWLENTLRKSELNNLDLVVIQLGEHYPENSDFEKDITELTQWIRETSPNVEIVWVGLWSGNEKHLNDLPSICERLEIEFVAIRDLATSPYRVDVTEDLSQEETTAEATYFPNQEGMRLIAERIMKRLKFEI